MISPPRWTKEQLQHDRAESIEIFRKERMEEPLEDYLESFEGFEDAVENLMEKTVDLRELQDHALEVLTEKQMLEAFRYLAGPPISTDDLNIIADVHSLSRKQLESDPSMVHRIVQVVLMGLDRRRFPWIPEDRDPSEDELKAAILASAVLLATQRVGTNRRSEGKGTQETRVGDALTLSGFNRVATRRAETLAQAPGPGEFCGESYLSNRKADFLVRLWDTRVMPVECKVSSSATNSVKRLNNDAAVKAGSWIKDLGSQQIVPVAILSGVFKLHNLQDAQDRGLTLFWAHNLKELTDWIEQTRPQPKNR